MTDVSVVIPFVHEYPALIHTLFAVQNEFLDLNYTFEIIVVENREKDPYTDQFLHYFRVPRHLGFVKYFFEPVPCGPAARMKGAHEASGKYLIFMDAHTQPGKNTVPMLLDLLEQNEHIGIVHGSTVYSHWSPPHAGAHYDLFGGTINLYSHFHGRYQRAKRRKEPYPVAGASLAYMGVRREEFLRLRGYHPACRGYPHPEGYVPLKYWMMDLECWAHPTAFHFHSLYPRKYGSPAKVKVGDLELMGNDNLIRNAMICAYTLGGKDWIIRVYKEWYDRGGNKDILTKILESAIEASREERRWILNNAEHELSDVLNDLKKREVPGLEQWNPQSVSSSPIKTVISAS